ncbi:MAG: STAS domain-containing protein [Clostridia bacterium]|nr:STAS domain-containing protein [Clostridia bacterium]
MLQIRKTIENGKATLAPEGRLDTVTAPELEKELRAILPGLTELALDFEKLEYVSSAGLRVLLTAQKGMNASGGKMTVCRVNDTVREIFDVTGFTDILTILP